jgi:PKD repeat protein/subtilisin family serine protease
VKSFIGLFFLMIFWEASAQSSVKLHRLREEISKLDSLREERIRNLSSSQNLPAYLLVDVTPSGTPVYRSELNAESAITTGVAKLQSGATGLLLEGKDVVFGVWDGGLISPHIELDDRVLSNEGFSFSDHATHVTGTLIASGINPSAKGMAPRAKVIAHYFDNDDAEIAALARNDQNTLLISNHSYGQVTGWTYSNGWVWTGDQSISDDEDFQFGFYGQRAKVLDQIAYLAPYYSVVWAAGNDRGESGDGTHPRDCNKGTGYDCIIPDAVGKNIITVGAVQQVLDYMNSGSVVMSDFSSWGPTDDGRIKPDLVGDGVDVFSLSASETNGYSIGSGTSMATPNVAGSLALLQELYSRLHGGNYMKAATLKALAIHTAKEAGNFPGPDYSYGWGLLDVEAGAKQLISEDNVNSVVKELTLNNGEQIDLTLSPKVNQNIKATIAWTDPAATPVADKLDPSDLMLVNDLDIKLVDTEGNRFFPWTLDPGKPSQGATKGNNVRDNVEKIEFDLPNAKAYHLIVSHKGELINDKQDFSLIISYQSAAISTQTFYWIGDTGDWNDPSHWSFSSGGESVNKIPGLNDYVIMDENSFDGQETDQINFSQDHEIASLLWINSKPSGMALNNHSLSVSKSFRLASSEFQSVTSGSIFLNSPGEGILSFNKNNIDQYIINLNQGDWKWQGNSALNRLIINNGSLEIEKATIKLNNLVANSANEKKLNLNGSSLEITEGSLIDSTKLILNVEASDLYLTGDRVILDWDGVMWEGELTVREGTTVMQGNNSIRKMALYSNLEITGQNQIDSLIVNSGADLFLAQNTEQTVNHIQISSLANSPVIIRSNQAASVNLAQHEKFCFDFLQVTNVEAKGIGVINAGENATLSNAKGWNAQKCEEVLFADFITEYSCEGALTNFMDKSQGNPTQWEWTFPESIIRNSKNENFSFIETGKYPVTLKVSNETSSQSYTKEVEIGANSFPVNQIVMNDDEMYSFSQATSYQWFKDGEVLVNETQRKYLYGGQTGTFFVLIYDNNCNRISEISTITGLEESESNILYMYPNPADQEVIVELKEGKIDLLIIRDVLGRELMLSEPSDRKITLPLSQFNEGVYVIETSAGSKKYRDKILIKH